MLEVELAICDFALSKLGVTCKAIRTGLFITGRYVREFQFWSPRCLAWFSSRSARAPHQHRFPTRTRDLSRMLQQGSGWTRRLVDPLAPHPPGTGANACYSFEVGFTFNQDGIQGASGPIGPAGPKAPARWGSSDWSHWPNRDDWSDRGDGSDWSRGTQRTGGAYGAAGPAGATGPQGLQGPAGCPRSQGRCRSYLRRSVERRKQLHA